MQRSVFQIENNIILTGVGASE